jgi:PPM family protein phosphatase
MALTEKLQFHAATDVGRKRSHNEDNYLVDSDLGLFIVADGMGGHAAGEVASAVAVRTVHEVVKKHADLLQDRATHGPRSEVSVREILSMLELSIQTASQRIHSEAQQDKKKRGMGTTCSVLLVVDSYAYVAHVGDSRIYLQRGDYMHQITEDHTVANELLRLGMVSPDQLAKVPRKNAITRAVGVYQHAEVDTLTLEVVPKDRFLLCSDGLHGYFDDTGEDLRSYLAEEDGEVVVNKLVAFANEHGGKDNITGVLVQLGSGDNSDSVRARRVEMKREMLAGLPLFSRLSERELLHVMQVADVYQYEAGEHIVRQGERGDQMFVMLQGRLKVASGPTTLIELGPGEHFGEMALIRNMPRSADVVAMVPSEVVCIRRSDFFDIIRSEPHIAVKLLWQFLGVLAHRLEQTSTDLSKARAQLGIQAPSPTWIDEEPSLDPFTAAPVAAALSAMGIDLGGRPSPPPEEPVVAQRVDAPPLGAAPEMAQRIEDAPSFDSAGGGPSPLVGGPLATGPQATGPQATGPQAVSPQATSPLATGPLATSPLATSPLATSPLATSPLATGPIAAGSTPAKPKEFDSRTTRPRTKLEKTTKRRTLKMNRDAITIPDPAALGGNSAFNGKSTLPSATGPRGRSETLKSVDGASQPAGRADFAPTQPAPDSHDVPEASPSAAGGASAQSDSKTTRPDGEMRLARESAMGEDGRRTIKVNPSAADMDEFRPTKVTIPLEPPDSLKSELDQLRKEFRERLKKSREARGRKDSD